MNKFKFTVNYDNLVKIDCFNTIPNNWVLWGLKEVQSKKGVKKWTKPPLNPKTLGNAMSNNKGTWGTFEYTKSQQLKYKGSKNKDNILVAGIGLMLPETKFIFVDLDHCIDKDGNLSDLALNMVNYLNSYTEISPSGEGLRIVIKDDGSFDKFRNELTKTHLKNKNIKSNIEIYSADDKRYCTFTGNSYNSIYTINKNMKIKDMYLKYWKRENVSNPNNVNPVNRNLDYNSILDKLRRSNNVGQRFINIFDNGLIDDDNSRTDLELMKMIAWYTQDRHQAIEIYLQSNHHHNRSKDFDKSNYSIKRGKVYVDNTFDTALSTLKDTYNPNYKSNPKKSQQNKSQKNSQSEENLDLKPVKWNIDYVFVKFENAFEKKETIRLSEFIEKFKDLKEDDKPEIEKTTVLQVTENVICLLSHYNIEIKYNVIKSSFDVFLDGKLAKYNLENYSVEIRDMCEKQNFRITKEKLNDILVKIALDNEYNPIEEYLKASHKYYLKHQDKDIFYELMDTIKSDSPWKKKFIGKFLLQMINLACSDEESQDSADYMLVLQGPQFIGKTTWLRNLLPEKFRAKYFLGGRTLDPTNKDDRIETTTNWLVEMGEISSTFRKSDQEALKNFITDFKDKFRLPYAKEAIEKKRRTSLCGSTNDVEYLKDLTGTRRFLTLNCLSFDKNLNIDIDMLWGYMYSLYLKNVDYKFTDSEVTEIMNYNDQFVNKPEKILVIEDVWNLNPPTDQGEWKTAGEIFAELPAQTLLNKFTIGREMKKTKTKFKRDTNLNKDVSYVSKNHVDKAYSSYEHDPDSFFK